jgi:hypothetical protein
MNGGLCDGHLLASAIVDGEGPYRLESAALTELVTAWAANPGENFGLLVAGDETVRQTSKAFASRESPDPELRPVLEITIRPRPVDLFPRPSVTALGRR